MAQLSDAELQLYIDTLRESGSQVEARRAIRRNKSTIAAIREADPVFAEAEAEAEEEATDALVVEARRRAVEGVDHFTTDSRGNEIRITKFSDTLLIFLLKGAKPDVYADRTKSEISGPGGAPVAFDDTTAGAKIAAILEAAKRRKEGEE